MNFVLGVTGTKSLPSMEGWLLVFLLHALGTVKLICGYKFPVLTSCIVYKYCNYVVYSCGVTVM